MFKHRLPLLCMGLFAFGVGTSATTHALPISCSGNGCLAAYNHCMSGHNDPNYCERNLIACEAPCDP